MSILALWQHGMTLHLNRLWPSICATRRRLTDRHAKRTRRGWMNRTVELPREGKQPVRRSRASLIRWTAGRIIKLIHIPIGIHTGTLTATTIAILYMSIDSDSVTGSTRPV